MAFRTIEITKPADIHIRSGQLEITQESGVASIPIEDIAIIMTIGPNIRLSTMDLSILAQNKVAITTLDNKYLPTAMVLPFEGNARQSRLIHRQVELSRDRYELLWIQIIKQKISNQARALSILGFEGVETVSAYVDEVNMDNVDYCEAAAAKEYFAHFHEGLNRRSDDPVNSRLNYGYSIMRSAIARNAVSVGCHPAFGIHHNNQLNPFNLADDLIEAFRPMVDMVAHANIGPNERVTKAERYEIAGVVHNGCVVDGAKMNALSAIAEMCESLKRIIGDGSEEPLKLPTILPVERMEGVTE